MPRTKWGSYFETILNMQLNFLLQKHMPRTKWGSYFETSTMCSITRSFQEDMPRTKWGSYFETYFGAALLPVRSRYASHQVGQLFRDWTSSVFCLPYAFHMPRTKWGSYFETWLTSPIFTQSKLLYASHQVGQLFRDACVIGSTLLCKLLFNMPRTKWGSYFETVSALIYYRSP